MIGPGKYDDLCTAAREQAKAQGAILIIFNGQKGSSFCCQLPLELALKVPAMLRNMADDIEATHESGQF